MDITAKTRLPLYMALAVLGACSSDTAPELQADALTFDVSPDAVDSGFLAVDSGFLADADALSDAPNTPDRTNELYDPAVMRTVSLTIEQADWDTLRRQSRSLLDVLAGDDCVSGPFDSPFTWFEAEVTIDGQRLDSIDIRKKGFIGSLDDNRPGIKLDLGEYVAGQSYLDARHITLNNAKQDPAVVRQCLGYWFAERAGLAAPRCSFATLAVNDREFGVYVNIEPLKRAFVERWYGNFDGNFYEGTLSDFTDELSSTFEAKNGDEDRLARPDLDAVRDALRVSDDELIASLEAVIDLDQFMTFWAVEVLLTHVDGYAANRNNYYLYQDPATGLFQFIPWGMDGILGSSPVGAPHSRSVYAEGALPARLYAHPEGQRRYYERLDELLEGSWDETALLRELERMTTLVLQNEPDAARRDTIAQSVGDVRDIIRDRREQIQAERAEGEPIIEQPDGFIGCFVETGTLEAEFETTWGSVQGNSDAWFEDEQRWSVRFEDDIWQFIDVGAAAGIAEDTGRSILLVGVFGEDRLAALNVQLGDAELQPGEAELDGSLLYSGDETGGEFVQIAWAQVTLRLDEGSEEDAATIRGTLEATLLGFED
jgi:spore coat protein CotH